MTRLKKLGRILILFCCGALILGGWIIDNKNNRLEFEARQATLVASGQTYPLTVEIADTPAKWEQGLMFRKGFGATDGMLFIFGDSQQRFMWMKNTYVPLDMVFLDANGTVVDIARGAVPESEEIISSLTPSAMVLELPAGKVQAYNLQVGDALHVSSAP